MGNVLANACQHSSANSNVGVTNIVQQLLPGFADNPLDFFDDRLCHVCQHQRFAASVTFCFLSDNQLRPLKRIEQPDQGRPFNSHTFREILLKQARTSTGNVQKRKPSRVGDAKRLQLRVHEPSPRAVHSGEFDSE